MTQKRLRLKDMNPVDLSIFRRESAIKRMRDNIQRIKDEAAYQTLEINKRIREKQILLDALKRGNLKP